MPRCSLVENASKMIKSGANGIKLEGCNEHILTLIKRCVESGIPVLGHLGFTPQLINTIGGYKIQGKTSDKIEMILESAKKLELQPVEVYDKISTTNETALLKILMEFEDVIIDCAQNRAPYKMANYIQHIAQLFHSFYNECRVIDENNLELTSQRLKLVQATKIVLANALSLIGVSAPQSM